MKMTWEQFIHKKVIEYCNQQGSRTFSLKELWKAIESAAREFRPKNKHPLDKTRQQLQLLRDEGHITFLDNSGHYTLRGIELLDEEKRETRTIDLSEEEPMKREYIIETYVRETGWAKKAREKFGEKCMCNIHRRCDNSFRKEDGTPYIEVHHIIPLCQGGEQGLWNLSVLCAHHHRMAHFADSETQRAVEKYLEKEVRRRL